MDRAKAGERKCPLSAKRPALVLERLALVLESRFRSTYNRSVLNSQTPTGRDPGQSKSLLVQIARYSELAFIFPAATVVGWLIGAALDHWLHTTWLYLAGLIVGIIAGFIALIRAVTSPGADQ